MPFRQPSALRQKTRYTGGVTPPPDGHESRVDQTEPPREAAPFADPGEVMRTCPVCGKPLAERKCKLFCPDPVCGYYLSCADFY